MLSIYQLFGVNSKEQFADLISAREHQDIIRQHRAELIASRIYPFALLFAVLVPVWGVLDLIFLPSEVSVQFLIMRLISGAAFFALAYVTKKVKIGMKRALTSLIIMLMVPTLFYQFSTPLIDKFELTGIADILIHLYGLLPYVVIASLALFPLTLKEFSLLSLVLVGLSSIGLYRADGTDITMLLVQMWLLVIILGVSMFSSLQQVRYLISQTVKASYDGLTKLLTRRAGMDIMESLFRATGLQHSNFSVLFIDLDKFKNINDTLGHDAGDEVLRQASKTLGNCIRRGDAAIRWGGEEFLILLPHTDAEAAKLVVKRIMERGLAFLPDGSPVTASIGLAELVEDDTSSWKALVECADQRLYTAKQTGRAKCICPDGSEVLFSNNEKAETVAS
jgi:diguanylate cyclase (GGDEF)-like protein